ncbi:RidA family protein [Nocardioides sp. dk4132]|uniref:RidA family protein n=1 Tax=unclassified Nocardioides TaxID=2615069 RepID=UPI001294EE8F|nr:MULTISPECIES: RidA family protein [unclassified Nocardioides]MQW76765.1 RidA family protein [Nocardioides sp. dk4132]QGA06882.1 RidA family protein [Nocardioides sp. dk884]
MTLNAIKPAEFPWFPYEGFTFCLGLSEGDAAWTSGHTSARHDPAVGKMTVSGSMEEQSRIAYEKCLTILAGAGFGPEDVTRVTENVTLAGLPEYETTAAVRREVFGAHEPTVRTVVVERLVRRAAWLEVELHAVKGGGEQLRVASEARDAGTWVASPITEGHDGTVYLPTMVPVDASGEVVHPGDFAAQYRYCLEQAGVLLEQVGLSLDHAVTTYDYSTPDTRAEYRKTHRVRKELLGNNEAGVYPGAGGILMSRLHKPGQLVAIDVTASRHPLELVNPGWSRYDTLTYAPGVKAGRTLFMSGFAALDMETQEALHPGDIGAQAEVTFEAILHLLKHAGLDASNLLETTEYCVESAIPDYRAVAGVRERLLQSPWPASTGAICQGLLRPEFLLEVFPLALYPVDHPAVTGAQTGEAK